MSRASLVQVYLENLPFTRISVVAIPGGHCRIAVGGEVAPGETAFATYYVKPLHVELLCGAAGLSDEPIDQPPNAVAALLEKTARAMGAPYDTEQEIRAAAERQVAEIVERVNATNQAGGLTGLNQAYKVYREKQILKAERAISYSRYLEQHYTVGIVRSVAMTARAVI